MSSSDLGAAYRATRDDLREIGIDDSFFLDLLAARLVVERVGETDNLEWWESRVLSETGRDRLTEVTPKTHVKARISLAQKVGRKAERDQLPADAVSLFSFGPRLESRLEAAVEEIQADDETTFEALEQLSGLTVDSKWTAPLIAELNDHRDAPPAESLPSPEPRKALLLADDGRTMDEVEAQKRELLTTFLRGYGKVTEQLAVPYYPLEAETTA